MNILSFIFGVVFLFSLIYGWKMFLKKIYYPANPRVYTSYKFIPGRTVAGTTYENTSPNTACYEVCYGEEKESKCEVYTAQYDKCTNDCYGYVYNSCDSQQEVVKMIILY